MTEAGQLERNVAGTMTQGRPHIICCRDAAPPRRPKADLTSSAAGGWCSLHDTGQTPHHLLPRGCCCSTPMTQGRPHHLLQRMVLLRPWHRADLSHPLLQGMMLLQLQLIIKRWEHEPRAARYYAFQEKLEIQVVVSWFYPWQLHFTH